MEKLHLGIGKFVDAGVHSKSVGPGYRDYILNVARQEHLLVRGKSGWGKTVLFKDIVEEAILAGCPCLVVDPKGDLAQLAWPYGTDFDTFEEREKLNCYPERYERFGVKDKQRQYCEKLSVELFDHDYSPSTSDIKWAFTPRSSELTPLTIVSLHLSDQRKIKDPKTKAEEAVRKILESIHSAVNELDKSVPKFLFIDEAHRFSDPKSSVYKSLTDVLRETCRSANLTIGLSTQSESDYPKEFVTEFGFEHVFAFEKPEGESKYKCTVLHPRGPYFERAKDDKDAQRNLLLPRWTFTIHKDSINSQQFCDTKRIWEVRNHPSLTEFSPPPQDIFRKMDETSFKILSCMNDMSISHEWNAQAIAEVSGISLNKCKSTLDSLKSTSALQVGHYHAWLDYEKLGFPITAFFVTTGKKNWREEQARIVRLPEVVEFYEIKCKSPYLNVNLLFKLRFENMKSYNDFVCSELLKISQRGITERERFKECHRLFKEHFQKFKKVEYMPVPPGEQIVSGCICARTFVDHPTCFVRDNTIDSLKKDQTKILNAVREVEDSSLFSQTEKTCVKLDLNSLSDRILTMCKDEKLKNRSDVLERMKEMAKMGMLRGVYFELPWEKHGYESTFVLGQLNFGKDIIKQAQNVADEEQLVQEVHTIAGTYDILVKLRGPIELNNIDQKLGLKGSLVLEVKDAYKVGFRFHGRSHGLS